MPAQVTGLALSPRHPYMFSCGLDKQVKCWDLEYNKVQPLPLELRKKVHSSISPHMRLAQTNPCSAVAQVIRQYHGHLSGVYALALHPALDILMTGGRDSVCRVWDMRTKVRSCCSRHNAHRSMHCMHPQTAIVCPTVHPLCPRD